MVSVWLYRVSFTVPFCLGTGAGAGVAKHCFLMRRVFALDVLECPRCGGRMRILAAIDQPEVIRAILTCRGLAARAPPPAGARPRLEPDLLFDDAASTSA